MTEEEKRAQVEVETRKWLEQYGALQEYDKQLATGVLSFTSIEGITTPTIAANDIVTLVSSIGEELFAKTFAGKATQDELTEFNIRTAAQNIPNPAPEKETVKQQTPYNEDYHETNYFRQELRNELQRAGVGDEYMQQVADHGGLTFTRPDGSQFFLPEDQMMKAAHLTGARGFAEAMSGNASRIETLEKYSRISYTAPDGKTYDFSIQDHIPERQIVQGKEEQVRTAQETPSLAEDSQTQLLQREAVTVSPIAAMPLQSLNQETLAAIKQANTSMDKVLDEAQHTSIQADPIHVTELPSAKFDPPASAKPQARTEIEPPPLPSQRDMAPKPEEIANPSVTPIPVPTATTASPQKPEIVTEVPSPNLADEPLVTQQKASTGPASATAETATVPTATTESIKHELSDLEKRFMDQVNKAVNIENKILRKRGEEEFATHLQNSEKAFIQNNETGIDDAYRFLEQAKRHVDPIASDLEDHFYIMGDISDLRTNIARHHEAQAEMLGVEKEAYVAGKMATLDEKMQEYRQTNQLSQTEKQTARIDNIKRVMEDNRITQVSVDKAQNMERTEISPREKALLERLASMRDNKNLNFQDNTVTQDEVTALKQLQGDLDALSQDHDLPDKKGAEGELYAEGSFDVGRTDMRDLRAIGNALKSFDIEFELAKTAGAPSISITEAGISQNRSGALER